MNFSLSPLFLSSPFFFPFSLSFSLVPFLPLFEFLALFLVGVWQFSHFYSQFWQFSPYIYPLSFFYLTQNFCFVYSLHKVCSERASNLQEYMNWFGRETHFLTVIFCNAKLWVSFIVSTCIPVIWFYRCKLLKKLKIRRSSLEKYKQSKRKMKNKDKTQKNHGLIL